MISMKKRLVMGQWAGILLAAIFVFGCKISDSSRDKNGIYISEKVLKTADWAGYKYRETLQQAAANDNDAIKSLLLFYGTVDGAERLDHTITCIELAALLGDRRVAEAIVALNNPRLTKVVKENVNMAMTKTTNPDLQNQPFESRFPLMWLAINDQKLPQAVTEGEMLRKQRQAEEAKKAAENGAKPTENGN